MVSLGDFELLPIYRILIFQMNFVFVVPGQSQVIFINADGLLVFVEEVQVFPFEFIRHLEVATSGDVLLGQLCSWCVRNVVLDNGADSGGGFIREGVELVLFHFDNPHDVVPFDGDLVRGTVFNDDLAFLVIVDSDKGWDSCHCRRSWTMECRDICLIWVCFPIELRGDDAGCHGRNGNLFDRADSIHFFVGEFDLPGVHIVDQFVAVHEVDADDIVVELVDDVHWMGELLSFDVQVHFIDPERVHCVSRSGNAALCVGDLLGFLVPESSVEGSAVHAGDGCSSVE